MHGKLLNGQGGTTLIELVAAIVIASVALVSLVLLTSQSTGRSVDPMIQVQASALAQSYMEEIMQKDFCDPDWDSDSNPATPLNCPAQCTAGVCSSCKGTGLNWTTEASRDLYDDICDYVGTDNPPVDQLNNVLNQLDQYTVTVEIIDNGAANLNGLTGTAGQSALINVSVQHPAMQSDVRVSGYRTNF